MNKTTVPPYFPPGKHFCCISDKEQHNGYMHGYNSKCRDFPLLILNTIVMILLSSWKIEQTAPNVSSTGSKGKWGQETNSFRHSSCFQLEKVVIFLSPAVRKVNLSYPPPPFSFSKQLPFFVGNYAFFFFWPALIFNSSCESDLCHGNFALMLLGNVWATVDVLKLLVCKLWKIALHEDYFCFTGKRFF